MKAPILKDFKKPYVTYGNMMGYPGVSLPGSLIKRKRVLDSLDQALVKIFNFDTLDTFLFVKNTGFLCSDEHIMWANFNALDNLPFKFISLDKRIIIHTKALILTNLTHDFIGDVGIPLVECSPDKPANTLVTSNNALSLTKTFGHSHIDLTKLNVYFQHNDSDGFVGVDKEHTTPYLTPFPVKVCPFYYTVDNLSKLQDWHKDSQLFSINSITNSNSILNHTLSQIKSEFIITPSNESWNELYGIPLDIPQPARILATNTFTCKPLEYWLNQSLFWDTLLVADPNLAQVLGMLLNESTKEKAFTSLALYLLRN